ncbi:MAG: SAM-dependent methyltransferase [Opitutales bacterium]
MLLICQAGYEALLARELGETGARVLAQGPGWVMADRAPDEPAFAHLVLRETTEIKGDSVNQLAQLLAECFLQDIRGERIESTWPCVLDGPAELVGLGRRIGAVQKALHELLRKRLSRVAKLAAPDLPRGAGAARGLFVWFTDFGVAQAARTAWINGQRRMADDDLAPSRSYLKVEEAYVVLGAAPVPGETVVDLGAAPGGWSYSAAKRGARVIAIDNGPLKGGALDHPQIEHRREDAFGFSPPTDTVYDWLFCDLVEEPHHVLQHIVVPWIERGWCRRFVVNLKFGRVDAVALLRELRAPDAPWVRGTTGLRIRHLYHDREELTLTGAVRRAE